MKHFKMFEVDLLELIDAKNEMTIVKNEHTLMEKKLKEINASSKRMSHNK